jgi:hypothetical protein
MNLNTLNFIFCYFFLNIFNNLKFLICYYLLQSEKVLAMSQIKGEFQRQTRLENIVHANKKLKNTNTATSIVQEQQDDDQFNVSDDDEFLNQASDDLEHDIESSREWKNLINEWLEMIEDEEPEVLNQEDEENDDVEPIIDRIMDLDQILQKKHPLINKRAKWKLDDIFDFEKLNPPTYLALLRMFYFILFIYLFTF